MFKKFKIDKFNQKYAGKFLMFCPRIYEDITFYINVIAKCCHCQRTPYSPPILFNNIITKFNFDDYLEKLDLYMRSNELWILQKLPFFKKANCTAIGNRKYKIYNNKPF